MLRLYITGFILSLVLTIIAYLAVVNHVFAGEIIVLVILVLAVIQLVVQLFFFLHLGQESKPRWNTIFFISTVCMILVLVIGSIWIMNHLNYNMTPMEMHKYIQNQDGI
ncbi:MAG TPA: cytochrome o ubiquinol oxidase subunit IV [Candidatus Saccharimonadales bacterium]|nr:cytochrome o ubiquinol oxidase subunit IV [Candidatus Saccharimonadales bacterium]